MCIYCADTAMKTNEFIPQVIYFHNDNIIIIIYTCIMYVRRDSVISNAVVFYEMIVIRLYVSSYSFNSSHIHIYSTTG